MIESLSDATTASTASSVPVKEITKSMLVRYCHIDYDREIALVAIGGKGRKKQMLGVTRLTIETANAKRESSPFWCATATSAAAWAAT